MIFVHYADLEAHRAEHQQFTQVVRDCEKCLTECWFDEKGMKELAGAVTAWLIYHVVDTDQKIVAEEQAPVQEPSFDRYVDLVSDSALEVLSTVVATALVKRGLQCGIKPPMIGQDMEDSTNTAGTRIDTGSGWLDIDVQM